ncbi:MAG TPA: hypothetical protein VF461_24160 [Gemmatimonadaceae bacterium]
MGRARTLLTALLLAACTTPAPPPPAPAPPPEPVRWELVDVAADHSEWLDLPAYVEGEIGGATGMRFRWYRFQTLKPGTLEFTMVLKRGELAGFEVFDSSVVDRKHDITMFGSRVVLDEPQDMVLPAPPRLYYVKVYCEQGADLTRYTLYAAFTLDPPAPPEKKPVRQSSTPQKDPKKTPAPPPTPGDSKTKPVPAPPPTPAPVPVPVPLVEPPASTATTLEKGSVVADLGGDSGTRWVWYRVPLTATSNVRVTATVDGAPVQVSLRDASQAALKQLSLRRTGAMDANVTGDAAYIRVGPATGDAASRVTVTVQVKKSDPKATHTERPEHE